MNIYPHSADSERLLIGSIVNRPEAGVAAAVIAKGMTEEWFHIEEHKAIFKAIRSVIDRDEEIDAIALAPMLESIYGDAALAILVNFPEYSIGWKTALRTIRDRHIQRQVIRTLRETCESITSGSMRLEDLKEGIAGNLSKAMTLVIQDDEESATDIVKSFIERKVDEAQGKVDPVPEEFRVLLGMKEVSGAFGHVDSRSRDNYVVVGAESSRGKSALMRQIINANLAGHDDWVICSFLLESSIDDFCHNAACSFSGINTRKNLAEVDGKIQVEYFKHLHMIRDAVDKRLFLFDKNASIEEIGARCKEIKLRCGRIDLVLVDYLQIVERARSGGSPESEVAAISRDTKNLQKALGCPLFSGTQMNEHGKVRESRTIFNDATRVWILDRPEKNQFGAEQPNCNSTKEYYQTIDQQKFRNGALCAMGIMFQVTNQRMIDAK